MTELLTTIVVLWTAALTAYFVARWIPWFRVKRGWKRTHQRSGYPGTRREVVIPKAPPPPVKRKLN